METHSFTRITYDRCKYKYSVNSCNFYPIESNGLMLSVSQTISYVSYVVKPLLVVLVDQDSMSLITTGRRTCLTLLQYCNISSSFDVKYLGKDSRVMFSPHHFNMFFTQSSLQVLDIPANIHLIKCHFHLTITPEVTNEVSATNDKNQLLPVLILPFLNKNLELIK